MGKPAARQGDTTAHGGTIVLGAPTVLIGGMPAARMGDFHSCPMVNPAPPAIPHVGGPILLGCPTVLICGQPAARMGDMATCTGPPDSIMGGCATVLIGEGAGGGGGAGSGSAASAALAGGGTSTENQEGHYLDVKFVDKAGKPVSGVKYELKTPEGDTSGSTLQGQVKKTGVKEGNYEFTLKAVTSAKWSVKEAMVGDKVKLRAETSGIDSGTPVKLEIYVRDGNSGDRLLKTIESKISGDKAEEEWEFKIDGEYLKAGEGKGGKKYSSPLFYFLVKCAEVVGCSGMLQLKDWAEFTVTDKDGKPLANKEYIATLSNGEVRQGKLDGNGHVKLEKVPPGKIKLSVKARGPK